ncbi:hypothetical protein SMD11_4228 [Streptomyces albireticuli]|uniref:Uncharacterized protein n=1 Tax=Streptomyces albireticuli TaxID=1940 RepID=A0A1Z2L6A7_9ACTN|nr:hypothetical protein SMD11_4228 [Streptomyces albireticuli]
MSRAARTRSMALRMRCRLEEMDSRSGSAASHQV